MRRFMLLPLAFLMIYGCLSSIGGQQYTQNYYSDLSRVAIFDPSQATQCQMGSCYCWVCESGRLIPATSFRQNLAGGRCYWESDCNAERAGELMSDRTPDLTIRGFMVGMGPSISDWADASPYCNNGLSMAVQWLIGNEDRSYDLPDASRAICLLTLDTIPVYVLYSNGTRTSDTTQVREIARILKEQGDEVTLNSLITRGEAVGPVIIVTEMDFERSDVGLVVDQVQAINDVCNPNRAAGEVNCFVAVAPKFNDYEAMDDIMQMPGMRDQVDYVAYGINYRYADECEWGSIMEQALNFSEHSLFTYNKPTVIPYILFDSVGTDRTGSCTWDEDRYQRAYGQIFPHSIQPLQQRGVIGMAPYSFASAQYGISNPLNCTSCDLGKSSSRIASFFAGCQALTTVSRGDTTHRGGGIPVIFPNGSAGNCDFNANIDSVLRQVRYADSVGGRDFFSPQQTLSEPQPMLYRCSACISENLTARNPPFKFRTVTFGGERLNQSCNATPEIDAWADRRNLDPMLVRAIIATEAAWNGTAGAYDTCSAVKVCSADYDGPGCFARNSDTRESECYAGGYDAMYDPRDPNGPNYCPIENDLSNTPPDWRRCAFGLMQTTIPPYTFWPSPPADEEGQYYDIFSTTKFNTPRTVSGELVTARSCAPDGHFNPFNVSHNVCIGTARIHSALEMAEDWMNNNRGRLNWPATDYERDNAFKAYIAANDYGGFWNGNTRISGNGITGSTCSSSLGNGDCWSLHFADSWEVTRQWCRENVDEDGNYPLARNNRPKCTDAGEPNKAACVGYYDFVEYVEECEIQFMKRADAHPGSTKMGAYYYLKDHCGSSFCPPHNRLITLTNKQSLIPTSGNVYVLDAPAGSSSSSGGSSTGGSSTGGSSSGGG